MDVDDDRNDDVRSFTLSRWSTLKEQVSSELWGRSNRSSWGLEIVDLGLVASESWCDLTQLGKWNLGHNCNSKWILPNPYGAHRRPTQNIEVVDRLVNQFIQNSRTKK